MQVCSAGRTGSAKEATIKCSSYIYISDLPAESVLPEESNLPGKLPKRAVIDTEVAKVLSKRLKYFGFEMMKELWTSNSAGK